VASTTATGVNVSTVQDPRQIDPALRAKYDVRGPRYTSYPPATHFASIDRDALLQRWRDRNGLGEDDPGKSLTRDPGLSLYFHIPFCRSRCMFCGCHTYIRKQSDAGNYVDLLIQEMALAAAVVDPRRQVHQVALGGGTPNFLGADETRRLLTALEQQWRLAPTSERSVEIDPRTATPEKLLAFLDHGFNRISLGVQDLDPQVIANVRRDQDSMQVGEVVDFVRQRGVASVNFDLIYGLPGQTLQSVEQTVADVVKLGPTRIALYSYAHVPWVHPHQKVLERAGLPDQDLKAALFLHMMDALQAAGYLAIGMDHFALPADPLALALANRSLRRNFMGYTTGRGLDIVAFGASAISSIGASYAQNEKELAAYEQRLQRGELPIYRGYLLDRDDEIRRELLLELFCNFRVDLGALSQRFGIDAASYLAADLSKLQPMVDDGLVAWSADALDVTDPGRFFIRNVCMAFDRHLEAEGAGRVYSRTV